jgi:hypothetical protein
MDQKIKTLLGDLVFNLTALQAELEKAQAEIEDLKKQNENKSKRT